MDRRSATLSGGEVQTPEAGRPARGPPFRGHLCPGRADDRPSPAGHGAPRRHAQGPDRPEEHGRRRRARHRRHPGGGPAHRHGPGGGHGRRPDRGRREVRTRSRRTPRRRPGDIWRAACPPHRPCPERPGPASGSPGPRRTTSGSIDVDIPSGALTAVTGVSGSGKSSLIFDVLTASAKAGRPVGCRDIAGLERFERVIPVDQEPLDGGPRSIPATYAGMFDAIRSLFAATAGAKARGFGRSRISPS